MHKIRLDLLRMRVKASAIIVIAGFIVAIFFSFTAIAVIDAPHNASNYISCGSCHGAALLNSPFWGGSYSPANIDDTVYNKLCLNCHRASSGPYTDTNAPLVKTHSSLSTSNKYGDWTRECRTCHDPHYQRQKNYKTTESGNLYLATGTITSCVYYDPDNYEVTYFDPDLINKSILTYSIITYKSGWYPTPEDDPNKKYLTKKTSDYRRTILFPNVGKLGYSYPVIAVDTITKKITVTGDATAYLYPPTTFAVLYGQYIKDFIDVSGTNTAVKFFDKAGAKSFADGDSIYNGVCEVCHTQTTHFRNDGSGSDQNHTNVGSSIPGTNCSACHSHVEGFKASCNACHGYPPPPLASIPLPTGSTTAGAHVLHVTTKGYQCSICHYNSAGEGITHNNHIITLGFVSLLGAYTGGSYDGQTSATYQSSDAGTTVSKTGLKKCSNLYCHGGTMAPDGGTASAIWDTPSSAACGTCHGATTGAPPTRGSHSKHTGSASGGRQLACTVCHSGYTSAHINGSVNWAYDTSTYIWLSGALYRGNTSGSQTPVPSTSYGTCSNLYCHSQGTSNTSPYPAPNIAALWGGVLDATCSGCHSGDKNATNKMVTGSHTKHIVDSSLDCTKCHNQTASDSRTISNQANHVNNFVNVAYDTASNPGGNGTYNGLTSPMTKIPGTAYAQCSNIYCHGSGTPAWGGAAIACDGCHKASNILQGKHSVHYESATVATNRNAANNSSGTTYAFNCGICHDPGATTHGGGAVSGIQAAQAAFDATYAGGGTYTAGGTLAGTDNTFNWTAGTCTSTYCHSQGTKFSSPYNVPNVTSFNWNSAAGTLQCNGCHGNTTYTADYRKGAPLYTTGSPKANAHVYHVDARATPTGETQCLHCHNATTNTNSSITGSDKHVNKAYDLAAGTSTYKDGDNVGGSTVAVTLSYTYTNPSTCSNVSCHSTGIAGTKAASITKWSNAYSCTDCHKINMNNTAGYHHVMDSTAMADRTYPTSAPSGSATDPNRKCTMCHVDHNILSPMLNASNTTGRSMNLRTAIGTTPTSTTGYTNSDYASGGGICISCHTNELTKNTTAQKSGTSSTTMAVTDAVYSASAHQNNMTSTMSNGGSTFNSNCSKCHNAKNGETTTFQSSANKFGTHDSTDGRLLFDTSDNFCFDCHTNTPYPNYTAIVNRSYSYRAGGYTTDTLNNISSAFSLSSKHKLSDIKTFINGKWGYTSSSNPCDACHNPHIAQGDPANLPNATKSPGTRGWPVSRPSQHATNYNNLWGDSTGEKMSDYTSQYQAPYRYGSTSNYEPDDSSTQNGSNLTDYNNFCTDCHNTTYTISSSTLGRNLKKIDWNNEKHGKGDADGAITMNNPYGTVMGKVLSCTDCHEPHGSPNVFLLRNEVNGDVLTNSITSFNPDICTMGSTDGNNVLGWFCKRCHKDDYDLDKTFGVVNQWKYIHHLTGDPPFKRTECYRCHWSASGEPITCNCCHYHGSTMSNYTFCGSYPVCNTPYDRRTF
jgi:predicted CxxxxCH...CXXCH cytochrome family protein